jgi:hypothetical protein
MRLLTLKKNDIIAGIVVALVIATIWVVAFSHNSAEAGSQPETPFVSYTPPTGPEMSSAAIANAAVRYAREWGGDGEITIELARGTSMQARTLMDGGSVAEAQAKENQLKSAASGSTFCFGGGNSNCTTAEQQHARETLYAEGQASTYLVVMSGSNFTPPEKRPKDSKPVTGSKMILLIDAHSGIRVGMTIGAAMPVPNLQELQGVGRFSATPESNTAQSARVRTRLTYNRGSHPRFHTGSIVGTLKHVREVVVFNGRHSVLAKARVSHNHFVVESIEVGSYSIAGRTSKGICPAKTITVWPHKKTTVHLTC